MSFLKAREGDRRGREERRGGKGGREGEGGKERKGRRGKKGGEGRKGRKEREGKKEREGEGGKEREGRRGREEGRGREGREGGEGRKKGGEGRREGRQGIGIEVTEVTEVTLSLQYQLLQPLTHLKLHQPVVPGKVSLVPCQPNHDIGTRLSLKLLDPGLGSYIGVLDDRRGGWEGGRVGRGRGGVERRRHSSFIHTIVMNPYKALAPPLHCLYFLTLPIRLQ